MNMRRSLLLQIVVLATIMVLPVALSAQEHKRVEVTTTYTPEITPQTKLLPPASIANNPPLEPEITYEVHPDTWQISLEDHLFQPAKASYWDFGRAKRLYAEIAAGYPLTSKAVLSYLTQNIRVGYFGVDVKHDASYSARENVEGVMRSMADSYDMRNGIKLRGGAVLGNQMFEAELGYLSSIYNQYAKRGDSYRSLFHDADLSLKYGDNFVDLSRLNFGVEVHGNLWATTPEPLTDRITLLPEFNAGGSVRLARDFSKNLIGLDLCYDMWQSPNDYSDIRFGFETDYARNFGIVDLKASLGYLYDKVRHRAKPSHFVTPGLDLYFNLGLDYVRPFLSFKTDIGQNGVASLYRRNPYLDYNALRESLLATPNTRSYDLSFGAMGSALSSHLRYKLYLGANFMRDQVVWYITEPGLFGVDCANNNRLFVGAELDYLPVGGLEIGAKFYAHLDNSASQFAVSEACMNGELRVAYTLKRWKFYVAGELIGPRTWSALEEGVVAYDKFSTPLVVNLMAGLGYRASGKVELYVDGYNLLNSHHLYDYAYYPNNGIGFMAGIKIDF